MRRLCRACWLAVSLLGCEVSGGQEQEGSSPPGLTETECDGIANALCTAACVCECELTGPDTPQSFPDEQACRAALGASCDGSQGTEQDGSACNGDVVKTIASYQCGSPVAFPASCDVFFVE